MHHKASNAMRLIERRGRKNSLSAGASSSYLEQHVYRRPMHTNSDRDRRIPE